MDTPERQGYMRCLALHALRTRCGCLIALAAGLLALARGCSKELQRPAYLTTLGMLNPEAPGYGADISRPDVKLHQPKAYCLLASAEARRFAATREPQALANAILAADWLHANADPDSDGIVGWGLPFPWDAGGDGTVNPADTEYAIETALGIQALLDVVEVLPDGEMPERGDVYVSTARAAACT